MNDGSISEYYDEVNNKVAKVYKNTETEKYCVEYTQTFFFDSLQEAEDKAEDWVLK